MVKTKPPRSPEGNMLKNSTDKLKVQATKTKRYQGKKTRTKTRDTELGAKTHFKGWCSSIEGYIFDLGTRATDKFSREIKDMEQYLGSTYSDGCQTAIITKTLATFLDPYMPRIIPYTGVEYPIQRDK